MANKKKFDTVIVGAGPAGSSAAVKLARSGIYVALVDKADFPRFKTCGGGIVHRARSCLPMDISPAVEQECFTVKYNLLASKLHFKAVRNKPIISMVMRSELDHLLVKEAERAGAEIITGCEVINLHTRADSIILETNRDPLQASFVIGADGALSTVAKKSGWRETRHLIPALECEVYVADKTRERFAQTARFDFELISEGYAWTFPKRDHLSMGVLSMNQGNIQLSDFFQRYLALLGITSASRIEHHGFVIPISPRKDELMRGRVLLIGDAAGFADPITAEGMSYAILSGQIASKALVEGGLRESSVNRIFNREIKQRVLKELQSVELPARLIYNYPKIRATLFRWYGHKLTKALTQVFMGEKSYTEIIRNPLNYLKLIRAWDPQDENGKRSP